MAAHGTFNWNELMTNDVAKAKAFYAATLGWTFTDMPMPAHGVYTLAHSGPAMACGMMDMTGVTPPGVPPHWFSYIEVDDVDHRVSLVEENGGKVLRAPFNIPNVGRIAIIADAAGAAFGLMTSTPRS
ncbi:VOC family protein [Methylocapsa sp. S129]|uniref:VOC family protein n=1 Tax=Methylocapsa sp. S129 TaxID=1641869 RepID=UPI00131B303C|nr:VOC family protein [Methylocapsa sp. S129]